MKLSLSYLTLDHHTIERAIGIAAQTGYEALGLRLAPAFPGGETQSIRSDAGTLQGLRRKRNENQFFLCISKLKLI